MKNTQVEYPTYEHKFGEHTITTGMIGAGFWARCGSIKMYGFRSERCAINAVKRRLNYMHNLQTVHWMATANHN